MPVSAFRSLTLHPTEDAATTAWVAAVVANGGSVSAGRRTIVNNFIVGMKADAIWTKLDRLWLHAAENQPSALTDLVGLTLATAVGSSTFTVDQGYIGEDINVSTKYVETNYNPSTDGVTYTRDAAHISVWVNNDPGGVIQGGPMGNTGGAGEAALYINFVDGNIYARINDSAGSQGPPSGSRVGHWLINRSGSSATQLYQSGALYSSPNATSEAIRNAEIAVCATSIAGRSNLERISVSSIGGNLSSTDVGNFYNRLATYRTAVGL